MNRIPKSIARRVTFKAFLASDHVTAATGKTIPVQISKNGASFANLATPANATEIGNGWYYVDLAIADISAYGPLIVRGTEANIDPVEVVYEVDRFVEIYQAAGQVRLRADSTVHFVSPRGSEENDGLTPGFAKLDPTVCVNSMNAGEATISCVGLYDLTARETRFLQPAATVHVGAGREATFFDFGDQDDEQFWTYLCVYRPGSYSYQADFTIRAAANAGDVAFPMGAFEEDASGLFVHAMTERVHVIGGTDGFYVNYEASEDDEMSWTLVDCTAVSDWDTYAFFTGSGTDPDSRFNVTMIRCEGYSFAPAANDDPARFVVAYGNRTLVQCYDCHGYTKTLSPSAGDSAYGVKAMNGAKIVVHGGSLYSEGATAGQTFSAYAEAVKETVPSTVILDGVQLDRSTLTAVSSAVVTEVNSDNQVTPTTAAVTTIQAGLATAQGVLQAATGATGTVTVVASTGVPATDGATLKAAIEGMSAGDAVVVGPGTFQLASESKITQPANTKVIGAGMDITVLYFVNDGTTQYHPGDYSYQSDFTIDGAPEYSGIQYGFGSLNESGFKGVVTERVKVAFGQAAGAIIGRDCFYFRHTTDVVQWTLIDCVGLSLFDTFAHLLCGAGSRIDIVRPRFYTNGVDTPSRGITCDGANALVHVWDPQIYAKTASTDAGEYGIGIRVDDGGTVIVHGGHVSGTGVMGSYDLMVDSGGGNLIVIGTQYDRTKTSGTITEHATDNQVTPTTASKTGYALSESGVAAVQSGLSTHSAADVKTAMEADGGKLDHLWETTEDNAGVRRFTTAGLANAPSGGLDAAGVRSAIGMAEANLDTQLSGISGGTGTGANTITITVTDGTDPLEAAKVRLTMGAETYLATTNASGVATLNVDNGTWTVAITLAGYSYSGTTLVVDGDETATYSMTLVTITPSDPTLVTAYATCRDSEGVAEAGVEVEMGMVRSATGATGTIWTGVPVTETSDANGLVQFLNCKPGGRYRIRRGDTTDWSQFTIPSTATTSYAIPDLVGDTAW